MMELDFSSVTSLSLAGTVTALLFIYMMRKTSDKYPPGPFAFPIIGNSPQILLSGSLAKFTESNHQKFGNVFTFVSGGSKRVVVSGYDAIYRLLVKNADRTSTRSTASMTPTIKIAAQKTPGVFWAPYPLWKDLRSFSISSMRDEGMGKSTLEPQLIEELELFIAHFIEPNLNNPIEMTLGLSQATNNMISQMLFHRRFDYNDEAFKTRIESINESISIDLKISMIGNLPFGKYFIKSAIERDDYISHNILLPALQHLIDEHKDDLDEHNPRDIMDKYLLQSQKEQNEGKANHSFSEENARVLALQMYIAGTETTATALRWALLFMCLHPDVKVKVQKEISEHLGSRTVSCKDRVSMPYTDAVLLETLRKASVAGVGLPHTLEKEMVIDGVTIPAGADLMINLDSVLFDEEVFEDPQSFKPERFLTGDITLKKQRTIPFGIGRRACLGEGLAKMEFFLFFVTFLQRYDIKIPEGLTVTDEPKKYSFIVNTPNPYEIIFSRR